MGTTESCSLHKQARSNIYVPKLFTTLLILIFMVSAFYPSDTDFYSKKKKDDNPVVHSVEHYVRFANTAAMALIPIILMDKIGMVQALYVGIATTVATQSLKRVFNHISIFGTELGRRPSGSLQNMPSGHSSMASCAMYFVIRRYGLKHALYLVPILLLTMNARLMLNAHTLSAVIAGCTLGILCAALFTSKYTKVVDSKSE